jgi:hypothetical protein
MAQYRIEALEKFIVRTTYTVEAGSPEEAEKLCKAGKVAYDDKSIEEGDEEWLEIRTVPLEEGRPGDLWTDWGGEGINAREPTG